MQFDILSIFPDIFKSYFNESMLKRAQENKLIKIATHDIRAYSKDIHKKVDDIPFGGGAGMVMTPQPLDDAINEVKKHNNGPVIFFTPQGKKLTQPRLEKLHAKHSDFILVCGRYEGIDQRIRDSLVDEEISVGDYVLTGGELPAMIFIDAISRLIPGVLGKQESHEQDSFSKSLDRKKEYPHYTRPAKFKGMEVPEVLRSGNHKEIEKWRRANLK